MYKNLLLLLSLLTLFISPMAHSHSGELDSRGGHSSKKNGYHLHNTNDSQNLIVCRYYIYQHGSAVSRIDDEELIFYFDSKDTSVTKDKLLKHALKTTVGSYNRNLNIKGWKSEVKARPHCAFKYEWDAEETEQEVIENSTAI